MDHKINEAETEINNLKSELNIIKQRELLNDVIVSGLKTENKTASEITENLNEVYGFGLENVVCSSLRNNEKSQSLYIYINDIE